MAILTKDKYGEGAMKSVELLASYNPDKNRHGNTTFITFSIHPDDPRAVGQTNPELRSDKAVSKETGEPILRKDGSQAYNTGVGYADSQLAKMAELAKQSGAVMVQEHQNDSSQKTIWFAVTADVTPRRGENNHGLAVNTQTLKPSAHGVSQEIVDRHFSMKKEAAQAKQAQAKQAQAATPEVTQPAASKDPFLSLG